MIITKGPKKKRKRVLHESDLIDRGLGYDLADSFVDDSELVSSWCTVIQ